MTHEAITFVLTDLLTGGALGSAVLCPRARYASFRGIGAARLLRRHLAGARWLEIERQVACGLPAGPLDSRSAIAVLFGAPAQNATVQYVSRVPIDAKPIETLAHRLDSLLFWPARWQTLQAPPDPEPAARRRRRQEATTT